MVPDWRPFKILSKPHVVFDIWCKTSGDMSLASWKVINLFFIFNHRSLREGGGGGGVSPSTEPLQTLHGTFLQVYKIENKVYCCNYNFKSEMPTLIWIPWCFIVLRTQFPQYLRTAWQTYKASYWDAWTYLKTTTWMILVAEILVLAEKWLFWC